MFVTATHESVPPLDAQLDEALRHAWMALQPIVTARTGATYGHEALLRTRSTWLPGPLQVLDAARRLGRLDEVGRLSRRLAAAALPDDGRMFVNLLASDLLDPDLGSASCPLRPVADRVVLEITEHQPVETIPQLSRRLARLRRLGFRIALDDFGAGYASVSAWAQIEPDVLKLDRRVVRGLPECAASSRVMEGIVELARHTTTLVVAEGIETEPQRRACEALGCDLLQGYLLGYPQ